MKISIPLLAAVLVYPTATLAQKVPSEMRLLHVATAPDGMVLSVDSASIGHTADSTFRANLVFEYPAAVANRYKIDTEVEHDEMDCGKERVRGKYTEAFLDDLPVRARQEQEWRSDWTTVREADLPVFGAVCRFLLGSFAAALPVRRDTVRHVEREPELTNRNEVTYAVSHEYPPELREARTTGTVLMRMRVLADGSVDPANIRIVRASDPRFGDAAARVAPHMRFRPAMLDGHPVPAWVSIPVFFALVR